MTSEEQFRANTDLLGRALADALADGALIVGVVGLGPANLNGDRRPVLYSGPGLDAGKRLLDLLRWIAQQTDEGRVTEVPAGRPAPAWWLQGLPPPPPSGGR